MRKIFYDIQSVTGFTINYIVDPKSKINVIGNSKIKMLDAYSDYLGVHLIRDPRDIVVSGYFSHLKTHSTEQWPTKWGNLEQLRKKLESVNRDEGLLVEMDFDEIIFNDMHQWNYNNSKILELKFEDFTTNPDFEKLFSFLDISCDQNYSYYAWRIINKLNNRSLFPVRNNNLKIPQHILDQIIRNNSFERLSGGRKKGDANTNSHYRKGISGEWKKYFKEEHKDYFKKKYPELLQKLGYETDNKW